MRRIGDTDGRRSICRAGDGKEGPALGAAGSVALRLGRIESSGELTGERVELIQVAGNHLIANLDRSAKLAPLNRRSNVVSGGVNYLLRAIAAGRSLQRKTLAAHHQRASIACGDGLSIAALGNRNPGQLR